MNFAPASSMFTRLLLLLLPILLLIFLAGVIALFTAYNGINQVYDRQLVNQADGLMSILLHEASETDVEDRTSTLEDSGDSGDSSVFSRDVAGHKSLLEFVEYIEEHYGLDVLYRLKIDEEVIITSPRIDQFDSCPPGFSTFEFEHGRVELENSGRQSAFERVFSDEESWRCYATSMVVEIPEIPDNPAMALANEVLSVEYFEPIEERTGLMRELLWRTFVPLLILPLLVLLLIFSVARWLRQSLLAMSSDVSSRSLSQLEHLDVEKHPVELQPVITSVNSFLDGIAHGLQREKQFTDDAAHELRTPITSIDMTEQLLRRDNRDPSLVPHLDAMRRSLNLCRSLISQLLGLARLESIHQQQMSVVNLSTMIHEQLNALSPQITFRDLSIELNDELYPGTTLGNELSLSQLLNNLIGNAVKFNRDGGSLYIVLDSSQLRIEDDGPGIPVEDRPRVFERFYRAAATRSVPGSGLGLALAKRIADQHDFSLEVADPMHGQGAAFVLTLTAKTVQLHHRGAVRSD